MAGCATSLMRLKSIPDRRVALRRGYRLPRQCVIIACALTIIERAILPGQRGGGKTTQFETLLLRSSKSEMMALSSPGKMNVG